MAAAMLIRNADVWGHDHADVRIEAGRIAAIGKFPESGEPHVDARGGALLPGLHDHHIHLAGLAARATSILCGPPDVVDAEGLARCLRVPGYGWLRGIGYHESVMGLPDAAALDQLVSSRPLRIQHRSGRMWLLNSRALEELLSRAAPPPGLERLEGRYTGHLFNSDDWLRSALRSTPPDFAFTSALLAAQGITGLTDMSPRNDARMAEHFAHQIETGVLGQNVVLAGMLDLADAAAQGWTLGPVKLHLHESALPPPDDAITFIAKAHRQARPVAIHCVTETELVFALSVLEAAGPMPGDRVEHASIADPHHITRMVRLRLSVCVQPHFVAERGDRYLVDVEPRYLPHLYRLASLVKAGLPLIGGSDAPFASPDPWIAMAAAVERRTASGALVGFDEALTPEQAVSLYLADPMDPARQRRISVGEPADLCLLDRPWAEARLALREVLVRLTLVSGRRVHDLVHQTPGKRRPG